MVFQHPKGYNFQEEKPHWEKQLSAGYEEIKTQSFGQKIMEKSDDWDKYRENSITEIDEEHANEKSKCLKANELSCACSNFSRIKSYRDLPVRLAEFGCCHRYAAREIYD